MTLRQATTAKWISIAVIVVAVMVTIRALPMDQLQSPLETWLDGLGFWGPAVFAVIYAVATVGMFPASLLTLVAGAVFGLGIGFLTVSIGSVSGAGLAFLIARYLARDKVESMAQSNEKFAAIDDAIAEGGWKIVALLRLSPAVPFNLQNYLYGLTSIRFWPYLVTSWIAMIPGTFLYVYLGHAAGLAADGTSRRSTGHWVLLGVGLLATVAVTVYITRMAGKKLRERSETIDAGESEPPNPAADQPTAQPPYSWMVFALVAVAVAMIAHWKSDLLEQWIS